MGNKEVKYSDITTAVGYNSLIRGRCSAGTLMIVAYDVIADRDDHIIEIISNVVLIHTGGLRTIIINANGINATVE